VKTVTRDQVCTSFDATTPPVLHVELGETFIMETMDRFATYEGPDSPPEAMAILKSMTGPVYVDGVRPGNTIKVELLDITIPLDHGWTAATPGRGLLGDRIPEFRKARARIAADGVHFGDKITIPLRPMFSRIGVAPREPKGPTDKGDFGGNMGNTQFAAGAAIYLPVFHDGALLAIADGHAAHGDGEATAVALECALDATLRITIEDRFTVNRPLVETASEIMTTGEGATIEEAAAMAANAMADLLGQRVGVDATDAAMLIACAADFRTCLAGHQPYTIRVAIPKSMLAW